MEGDRFQRELYIGDLDDSVTEEILFANFNQFGKITQLKIMKHIVTFKTRGFGFIGFSRHEEAKRALESMNNQMILNKAVRVLWKHQNFKVNKAANVLISNINRVVSLKELHELCTQFGPILSSKML